MKKARRLYMLAATMGLALLVQASAGAQAKPPADPPNPLTSVKAVAQTRTQDLQLTVENIDVADGTAEVRGTANKAFVSAVLSGWSLYFVENAVGQLNVTTVFAQEASPKKLKAVHSRHGYLQMQVGRFISEPAVSQNYGECEIVQ